LESHLQLPLLSHNPWRSTTFLWFFLDAEVGWHSLSFILKLQRTEKQLSLTSLLMTYVGKGHAR
jgi:hypothetical protein